MGKKPLCNAVNIALIDVMNTEYHRMTYCTLCTFQNDAIGYFDRVIPSSPYSIVANPEYQTRYAHFIQEHSTTSNIT